MRIDKTILTALSALLPATMIAANTTTTVEQVVESVTVDDDVDYVITSDTPFTTTGSVNITNTDHAVVIIQAARPSIVISEWLTGHVYINGQQARNSVNCQVKMYAGGAIIMPYASTIKPLTVYSEQDFGGTSVDDFGLENSGGYMNTLTDEKLNNNIRSFRLKRGYMVTFSTRASGRGYSRCFIAADADLEMSQLPAVLDGNISSYRIFTWYDAQKKGLASDTRALQNSLINSSWCYSWGLGESRLPDTECVANHIYEDWPTSAECGAVTYCTHMKTNNEPGNSSDDHPQDVETVLANWENLMRTGMRLCSESSHDGSMSHLQAFVDSIDARGWRCDLLDLHCYWPESSFDNWQYYYNQYGGRPIWISEWVWGASWNSNGIFATDRTTSEANMQLNADALSRIIPKLNASPYVERYAYWNSEADVSKIIIGDTLTLAGQYYASVESGMAYNSKYEKIPSNPPQSDPGELTAKYDADTQTARLTWTDYNGEYNRQMLIQKRVAGSSVWTTAYEPEQQELEAEYTVEISATDGDRFRIYIKDLNNKERYTNTVTIVIDNVSAGSGVTVTTDDGAKTMYVGGNMLINGNFDLGLTDWQNAAGEPLSAPWYQAVKGDGVDGTTYLQAYGNSSLRTNEQSIQQFVTLEANGSYYVEGWGRYTTSTKQRVLTGLGTVGINTRMEFPTTEAWTKSGGTFTITTDTLLQILLTDMEGKVMIDNLRLSKLFDTAEEADADARQWATQRLDAFTTYNTQLPQLNTLLATLFAEEGITGKEMETLLDDAGKMLQSVATLDSLSHDVATMASIGLAGGSEAAQKLEALEAMSQATPTQWLTDLDELKTLVAAAFNYEDSETTITNASFASATGWNTLAGTYTLGDQRINTANGKTCWNAWWSLSAEGNESQTMSVNQPLASLSSGLYALEAKASTEHYCETDQHAWLTASGETVESTAIPYGRYDMSAFTDDEKWTTLVTPYVFVAEGDSATIGFTGSKAGATDNSWVTIGSTGTDGDNREGWWCATDFTLRYIPGYLRQSDSTGWGTICAPSIIAIPDGVTLYQIVGITSDSLNIAVEEVTDDIVAGSPYLFRTDAGRQVFFTYSGTAARSPKTNVNGLRGYFSTTARYAIGQLVLVEGKWQMVTERYSVESYSAAVGNTANIPVLTETWTGLTIPTEGYAQATGIASVTADTTPTTTRYYNTAGQQVSKSTKGITISKGRKSVVR